MKNKTILRLIEFVAIVIVIVLIFFLRGVEAGTMSIVIAVGMVLFSSVRQILLNKTDIKEDLDKLSAKTKHYLLFLIISFALSCFAIVLLTVFYGKH